MVTPTSMKALFISALLGALALPMTTEAKTETLVLGGGCFWCTEAAYELLPGVKSVVSGYAGGDKPNPTYEQIGTGATGHAEVIRIEFDPEKTDLETLLDFFWEVHDPTTLNRQGADVGTQYRSIILYADPAQRASAEASLKRARASFGRPIVTQIVPLEKFWIAEGYHQNYFKRNPNQGYCQFVIAPKIKKLEHKLRQQSK
ncbi:MAG: peptide-methionine (S)-S-oxide reductase MsrA [Cephaloticoccus sp.]